MVPTDQIYSTEEKWTTNDLLLLRKEIEAYVYWTDNTNYVYKCNVTHK